MMDLKERLFKAMAEINDSGECNLSDFPCVLIQLRMRKYNDTTELFVDGTGSVNESIYYSYLKEFGEQR